ncbi:MAG: hypothetical protein HUJ68_01445 [Clostridia bacterium]|nr:hypothetical protein [Clostridia bacterium]
MALLDQYRQDIACIVHVNYHYRPSADRDEKIVRDYAKKHKIKINVFNVDSKEYIDKRFNFES